MSKTVLVAGACGFLGSYISELFHSNKWDIIAVDNLTNYELSRSGYSNPLAREYIFNYLEDIGVHNRVLDITNAASMDYLCGLDIDYIVNAAAQPTMTLSIDEPSYDFNVNAVGALNLLELARKLAVPIALCSSVHVYGNGINTNLVEQPTRFEVSTSINEEYPILSGDVSPLHASKRSMELYGKAYSDTYNLDVGVFRLTGMYGPRQLAGKHHGWVSNFIIKALKEIPIPIFGTDKQVRDILFGTDAAQIFMDFYNNSKSGIYNVGAGVEGAVSLKEVLGIIEELTGRFIAKEIKPARFGDMYYFVADITKAENQLGWKPTVTVREGLAKTVGWVNDNLDLFEGIQ